MKISVAVISYNAEETVLDTLESILAQDYGVDKVELVVSDDASTDRTVDVVREWLGKHGNRFHSTKLIKNTVNRGVPANYNAACRSCSGEWIKVIAADDILLEGCLSSNVDYVNREPSAKAVFSYMECFGATSKVMPYESDLKFFKLDAKRQNFLFRYFSFNIAPTQFLNKQLLEEVGYADERYRLFEDLPLWLKVTERGFRLHFNEVLTVKYRVGESVSKTDKFFINKDFVRCLLLLNKEGKPEQFPSLGYFLRMEERLLISYKLFLSEVLGNRRKNLHKYIYNLIWAFTPLNLFYRAAKRLLRRERSF